MEFQQNDMNFQQKAMKFQQNMNFQQNAMNFQQNAMNFQQNAMNFQQNAMKFHQNAMNEPKRLSYVYNFNENDKKHIFQWINELTVAETRENALLRLAANRGVISDLAPMLWNSFGSISALLLEIMSVYSLLSPPRLTVRQSNRVCNVLALVECLASHPETRPKFLDAEFMQYLYPFLKTSSCERLRQATLTVVSTLLSVNEYATIEYLLNTRIVPYCLETMKTGTKITKTTATFIMQRILLYENGLDLICGTYERFVEVARILEIMFMSIAEEKSLRLLREIVLCYLHLSKDFRVREKLWQVLPYPLKNCEIIESYSEIKEIFYSIIQLHLNLGNYQLLNNQLIAQHLNWSSY